MISTITTKDGALGFTPSGDPLYILGTALQGSTTQVQTFGDSSYRQVYLSGKLPDCAAVQNGQGVGPLAMLAMTAGTAGSLAQPVKVSSSADVVELTVAVGESWCSPK